MFGLPILVCENLTMEYFKGCSNLVFGLCCLLDGQMVFFLPSQPPYVSLSYLQKEKITCEVYLIWHPGLAFGTCQVWVGLKKILA